MFSQDNSSFYNLMSQISEMKKEKENKMNTEQEIRHLERTINKRKLELEDLYHDIKIVKSCHARDSINKDINMIERMIENKEFKLWKLAK